MNYDFGSNKCYGYTQDSITKDFMIIMDNYLLDDLIDNLFYKSGNKIVDDFIRNLQIKSNEISDIVEFIPFNQFKDIEFIDKVNSYEATWINGNIHSWNKKNMNFERSGPVQVILKRVNNSENITTKELNEVIYFIFNY